MLFIFNNIKLFISGGGHCVDFYQPNELESDGLKLARDEIFYYLKLFLA